MGYTYSFIQPWRYNVRLLAAWGVKLLVPDYTGPLVNVRSSAGPTGDIGFDAAGELDTTAYAALVGANNGFYQTWYEQVGGDYIDATTVSNPVQPRASLAGVIDAPGGLIAGKFLSSYFTIGGGSNGNLDSQFNGMTWVIEWYALSFAGFPGLLGKGNADSLTTGSYLIGFSSGGSLGYYVYMGGARTLTIILSSEFSTSTWYQTTYSWRSLYGGNFTKNGVLRASDLLGATATIDSPSFNCYFGTQEGSGVPLAYPLNGYIRSIRLYEYMTPSDAEMLYANDPP